MTKQSKRRGFWLRESKNRDWIEREDAQGVTIQGWEELEFFVLASDVSETEKEWHIYEGMTGLKFNSSIDNFSPDASITEAVLHGKGILDGRGKEKVHAAILKGVKAHGISPRYLGEILKVDDTTVDSHSENEPPYRFLDLEE